MKSQSPALHLVVTILLLLVLGGLFYVTERTILQVNMLEVEVNQQEANTERLQDLRSSLPGLTPQIENFLNTLPSNEQDVAEFAAVLEQEARSVGLVITFQFEDFPEPVDVSGQNIVGLGSEITLEGSFQGVTTFMSRLSALPYFFKVDKLTVLNHETKSGVKAIVAGSLMMNIERQAL